MLFNRPETIADPGGGPAIDLYADASALHGAASVQRVSLPARGLGATPHYHRLSTELFHVVAGRMWFLEGDRIVRAEKGDLVAIEPGAHHAFAAADEPAQALIVLTPGVERFGYFRVLAAVMRGQRPQADLLAAQAEFDNHFVVSEVWERHVREANLG